MSGTQNTGRAAPWLYRLGHTNSNNWANGRAWNTNLPDRDAATYPESVSGSLARHSKDHDGAVGFGKSAQG
jgi:hypothetical protein